MLQYEIKKNFKTEDFYINQFKNMDTVVRINGIFYIMNNGELYGESKNKNYIKRESFNLSTKDA
jgi:hypothetical protein